MKICSTRLPLAYQDTDGRLFLEGHSSFFKPPRLIGGKIPDILHRNNYQLVGELGKTAAGSTERESRCRENMGLYAILLPVLAVIGYFIFM
jgi:hypothetical protein